jgi:predicted nucleotidyltransferase
VERFVERVRQLDPVLLLLFGSAATGDYTQYSDADVLAVFERPVAWDDVYACSDGVVQPVVRTLDELVVQVSTGEPFYHEIVEEGVVLFDAGGVHDRVCAHAAAARERRQLERTPTGWRWAAG